MTDILKLPDLRSKIPYAGHEQTVKIWREIAQDAAANGAVDAEIARLWATREHDTASIAKALTRPESFIANRLAAIRDAEHGPSYADPPFACPPSEV